MKNAHTASQRHSGPQKAFKLTRPIPGDEPYPSTKFYRSTSGWPRWHVPKAIKRRSARICALDWAFSPATSLFEAFYLHRATAHWILWIRAYNDEGWPPVDFGIVKCWQPGLSKHEAAMLLLAACLDRERREHDLPRFDLISEKGSLLSKREIEAVANVVWSPAASPSAGEA
jgi:hypothetical protein